MTSINPRFGEESFCYLTTTGRRSGRAHTIEIWFALVGATAYMLSGGRARSDWVKNLQREPKVSIRIKEMTMPGRARLVTDEGEDALVRRLLLEKYSPGYSGDLTGWGKRSLAVAIDIGD